MSSGANALQLAVRKLAHGASLDAAEATRAFGVVMAGEGTPSQIAALLMALRVKGETPDEVAGAARALRDVMTVLEAGNPEGLVDTCGTGGGSVTTFNISTAAALLTAGAGARVAKHGNRSFTTRSGSADVIEALGIAIDVPVAAMEEVLETAGIVFMFAPTMHPAMRHVGSVRREIGVPTVMNIVGPLANPARAGRQVIGVGDENRLELIARSLAALGTHHSLVVHGEPGLDEISPIGRTTVIELHDGAERRWTLDPADLDLGPTVAGDLAGGSAAENASLIEQVLAGRGNATSRSAVLLNAAGAIYVAGLASDFQRALTIAREAMRAGAGLDALNRLRKAAPRR